MAYNLHILTRCTRPKNLTTVQNSVFTDTHGLNITWHVIFDTAPLKDIDAELLSSISGPQTKIHFINAGDGGLLYPQCTELIKGIVITGSSGLYESGMGESYPKRGDYEYIKNKAEGVFYDPNVATKEMIDEVFATVNDRIKLIKTLTIAKSAIRHNMAKDLPKMHVKTCIIWGENDKVTPPEVATEFHKLLPNSELYWIEKCGHAAMMEHPDKFNEILESWLKKNNL